MSCASLLIAAILFSVAGCCTLGALPGVGTSATNCCCAESDPDRQPPEAGPGAAYPPSHASAAVHAYPAPPAQPLAAGQPKVYAASPPGGGMPSSMPYGHVAV